MNPILDGYRQRFSNVAAYRPGASPGGGPDGRLSSNESAWGPSPGARAAAAAALGQLHRYPDNSRARAALARYAGVDPASLLVTNGSDEACYLIAALGLRPGSLAIASDPGYRIDEIVSRLAGADICALPVRPDGSHDLEAMARVARPGAVVWIPTPHNPTGAASDPGELGRFLERVSQDCLVVLDEAYRAYLDPDLRPPVLDWLARYPGLVVQRTLSKDHGLAGLRIGYALAAPEVVTALDAIRAPFDLNAVAAAAAVAAVEDTAWQARVVEAVGQERESLQGLLADLGVAHYPSQANFVTLALPHSALAGPLGEAGLSARSGEDLGLAGWTRITIGHPEQMTEVRRILTHVVDPPVGGRR